MQEKETILSRYRVTLFLLGCFAVANGYCYEKMPWEVDAPKPKPADLPCAGMGDVATEMAPAVMDQCMRAQGAKIEAFSETFRAKYYPELKANVVLELESQPDGEFASVVVAPESGTPRDFNAALVDFVVKEIMVPASKSGWKGRYKFRMGPKN